MDHEVYEFPEARHQVLDETPEPRRVKVVLMDGDDLPMCRGTAVMPLVPGVGVGVFWPDCPMPGGSRLSSAKCFALPGGETLKVKSLELCAGNPPQYDFRVSPT